MLSHIVSLITYLCVLSVFVVFISDLPWQSFVFLLPLFFVLSCIGIFFLPRTYQLEYNEPRLSFGRNVFANDYHRDVFFWEYLKHTLLLGSNDVRLLWVHWRAKRMIQSDLKVVLDRLHQQLVTLGTQPRFHERTQFLVPDEILGALIRTGVIWSKHRPSEEGLAEGAWLIGLNRRFDSDHAHKL